MKEVIGNDFYLMYPYGYDALMDVTNAYKARDLDWKGVNDAVKAKCVERLEKMFGPNGKVDFYDNCGNEVSGAPYRTFVYEMFNTERWMIDKGEGDSLYIESYPYLSSKEKSVSVWVDLEPNTYYVVEGKVTDANAKAIYDDWLKNGKGYPIHFVDYATAGARSAYSKVFDGHAYKNARISYSTKAGECTLDTLKSYGYNIIGSYNTGATVTKKTKKAPTLTVINDEVIQSIINLGVGNYDDYGFRLYEAGGSGLAITNTAGTYRYYVSCDGKEYEWNGKGFAGLKSTYSNLIVKAYKKALELA